MIAEVRDHCDGEFHFGIPDGLVVGMRKDQMSGCEWGHFPRIRPPLLRLRYGTAGFVLFKIYARRCRGGTFVILEIGPNLYYSTSERPDLILHWLLPFEQSSYS